MRIAYFILNSFDRDSRARLEVETLASLGHNVEIIVTVGGDSDSYLGFPVHRIKQWTKPSRKVRFLQYNIEAARIGAKIKPDVCHAVDLDTLWAAVRAARESGAKIVYEARELYTEQESVARRRIIRGTWRWLESRLIHKADRIITINDSIAGELCRRYGIDKPIIIRNVARLPENLTPVDLHSSLAIPSGKKILVYQGVLRRGQGLFYLLEIVKLIDDICLVFIGSGPIETELKDKALSLGVNARTRFVGMISPERLYDYTAAADAGLLLMEDVALNNRLALPQKLFQYLACGIPQIVSPMPEMKAFIEDQETGIVVPLADAAEAAARIRGFMADRDKYSRFRNNCLESASRNNWEKESQKLADLYRGLEI